MSAIPVEMWLILFWDELDNKWVIAEAHPHSQEAQAVGQLRLYRAEASRIGSVRMIHTSDSK